MWIKLQYTKYWFKLNTDCGSNYNIQNNGPNLILIVDQTITYIIMVQLNTDCGSNNNIQNKGSNYILISLIVDQTTTYKTMVQSKY